jgi:amidase
VSDPLHWWTARELVAAVGRRELSAREVVAAHLERIEAVNPTLNAIVSLRPEAALEEAEAADRRAARGEPTGPLHGLPIAIKDLVDTAGIRTTYGSTLFADHVPDADSLPVARLRAAGAIVVGKTNTPEFGAGSHTFNPVFGTTRNPWALDRSAGGSSGGAGAALASGMLPIADGSDHGGSIRNPASFNAVVGLRPTPGLVPDPGDDGDPWDVASVTGPMARSVGDLALMLTALAGPDGHAPLSHGDPAAFAPEPRGDLAGIRVAWSRDVGGLPIEPAVLEVMDAARARFEAAGARVEDVEVDLRGADEAFEVLRAVGFVAAFGAQLDQMRGVVKETVIWNVEQGLAHDGAALARAMNARAAVFRAVAATLERFDVIVAPAAQVVPFDASLEYPREIAGVAMPHYLGWMRACSRITVSSHPVAAVPAGFTSDGLPVGLQLVGRHRGDLRLLEIAAAWEAAAGLGRRRPPLAAAADLA